MESTAAQQNLHPPLPSEFLHPVLARRLAEARAQLDARGDLLSAAELQRYYAVFRERFGPTALADLDGERLLEFLHGRGGTDSLVYWLEFKNDDEFPAKFGSITGGSALKFGIYRSAETGKWMTGNPRKQRVLSVEEAIDFARGHKRQLTLGAAVLETYAADPESADYSALQQELANAAPDLFDSSWVHKYFYLLYPQLLDEFHALEYQRFHLFKLLRSPTERRYENAQFYLELARRLSWPVNHLTTVLNTVNGRPYRHWRVGTGEHGEFWPTMQSEGVLAVGWSNIADLSELSHKKTGKDELKQLIGTTYPSTPQSVGRQASELFGVVARADVGDIVVAAKGRKVRGIGRVTGEYCYAPGTPAPHRRPVEWQVIGDWPLAVREGVLMTFVQLRKYPANLVAIERALLDAEVASGDRVSTDGVKPSSVAPAGVRLPPLTGHIARIDAVLQRKQQVILYGPPGTGKTYWATRAVRELAARSWFSAQAAALTREQEGELARQRAIETCCFHPAYGYEDFLEGYRPESVAGGQLAFQLKDGVFKRLCDRARTNPKRRFFLVIDEINRGDVPRIFGELLLVLEKDKRGSEVTLPLSGRTLSVPPNVFVVGTMNTADRSVALLDAALRRRFGFVELMPDTQSLQGAVVERLPLGPWLAELNQRVLQHAGRDARNLQVGHSYLMDAGEPISSLARFAEVLRDDILPLLEEYCYEDFAALERIVPGLVDTKRQRVKDELFERQDSEALLQALLRGYENITTTPGAVEAEAGKEEDDDDADATDDDAEGTDDDAEEV